MPLVLIKVCIDVYATASFIPMLWLVGATKHPRKPAYMLAAI